MNFRHALTFALFAHLSFSVEAGCLTFIKRLLFENKETVARQKLEEHQEIIEKKDKEFIEEHDSMRLGGMLSENKLKVTTANFERFLKESEKIIPTKSE